MKHLKKMIPLFLLALVLIVSITLLTPTAHAATTSGTFGDGLNWSYSYGALYISGTGPMPDFYDDMTRPWYSVHKSVTRVSIGPGITTIGSSAFETCENLQSVSIPSSVTKIGSYAFNYCTSLTSVTIPGSVTEISSGAFARSGLTSVTIPGSVTEIESYTFEDCKSLTKLSIGSGVKKIQTEAFSGCSGLTSVTIPDTVTYIAAGAFKNCTGLTSFTIPSSVSVRGEGVLAGCTSLESITIPYLGVSRSAGSTTQNQYPLGRLFGTNFNADCFATAQEYFLDPATNTTTKTTYYIPKSLKSVTVTGGSILQGAFQNCTGLQSVTVSSSKYIAGGAFSGCSALTSITLPFIGERSTVTADTNQYPFGYIFGTTGYDGSTLVYQAYYAANSTQATSTGYYIPNNLKSVTVTGGKLPYGAFDGCANLTSITLSDAVTEIGGNAFKGCANLTGITLPDTVTKIGDGAFRGCTGLTSISIPDGVKTISNNTFYGCTGLTDISLPDGITAIGDAAFRNCKALKAVTIPEAVKTIGDDCFYQCTSVQSIVIPDSVTEIGASAFSGCYKLQTATVGDGVVTIGQSAFSSCSGLQEITLGSRVATIGQNAFSGCSSLTNIAIPASVTKIEPYAFYSCYDLQGIYITDMAAWCRIEMEEYSTPFSFAKDLYLNGELVTRLTIPDGVTKIGDYTFYAYNHLELVNIPASVTEIGPSAFAYCHNIRSVYYAGTTAQWNNILIGEQNEAITGATLHCSHIHDYTLIPPTIVDPTCTEQGYIEYTCMYGDSYREYLPALGHDFSGEQTVVVNCTTQGYTVTQCIRCAATERSHYTSPAGHDYSGEQTVYAPTCTSDGFTVTQCIRCTSTQVSDYIDPLGHDFSLVQTVVDPTCTGQGYTIRKCSRCTVTENTDYVDALGHDLSVVQSVVEPTCTKQGYTVHKCSRCTVTENTDYVDALGHDFQLLLTTLAPTCTEAGSAINQCSRCKTNKMVTVEALGHNVVVIGLCDPTCTQPGVSKIGTMCDRCQTVYVQPTYTPALGHSYADGVCTRCGDMYSDLTGDGVANNADVVTLVWYVLFPEEHPLTETVDFNGDGKTTNEDIVIFIWHVLFPEIYPLP